MQVHQGTRLAELTTLAVGGPVDRLVEVHDADELVAAVRDADAAGRPLLVLGGGSNVVAPDAGWPGDVVAVRSRGVVRTGDAVQVQAGEPWDDLVAHTVAQELAGMEALSGIPGSTGATPVQNVGAYGQEVAQTITAVQVLDRRDGSVRTLTPVECGFGYRDSALKQHPGVFVVLTVTFGLQSSPLSMPVGYAELARRLGVEVGSGRRWPTSGPPSSSCAGARAWCWTPPTPTPAAPGRSSPTRWCRPRWPWRAAPAGRPATT
ncbi:UDP-N-acetylmuramate dehydrogenase [Klenkia terrae]|uniref:UDP-N-acetylmuramate dehydrogenase n=1 Tax=Klenkia terrae TaxID=1052259 RepID=UPI00360F61EB